MVTLIGLAMGFSMRCGPLRLIGALNDDLGGYRGELFDAPVACYTHQSALVIVELLSRSILVPIRYQRAHAHVNFIAVLAGCHQHVGRRVAPVAGDLVGAWLQKYLIDIVIALYHHH